MSDGSSIEWCDATWTIAVGCTRVDHRCDNCYAIPFVHRKLHASHEGLTKLRPKDAKRPGVDWNGTVRVLPERLADPLRWRKARRIFVGSMTDLFHPAIPFEYIAAVFGIMAATPRHTFMLLTKRPERAREFFDHVFGLESCAETVAGEAERHGVIWDARGSDMYRYPSAPMNLALRRAWAWPLPNVHLGVSVSDQATADAAIPVLLECPAAVRWVSYEPALGPVDFFAFLKTALRDECLRALGDETCVPGLDTIVVGGESGPRARPFLIEWASTIVEQCRTAGVPVFVKQLGSNPWLPLPRPTAIRGELHLADYSGGDMNEWPADLRVREWAR